MGNPTASSSKSFHLFSLIISILVFFSCVNDGVAAVDRKLKDAESHEFHTIKVTSLLPDSVCESSSEGPKLPSSSSLEIVHKHGPCHKQHKIKESPSQLVSQILNHDESRVHSINSEITFISNNTFKSSDSVTLPVKTSTLLSYGNYIVTVGLGSPKKNLSLIFDTGSSMTWTQCEPCVGSCYNQTDPIFNPLESKTYTNVSCNAAPCDLIFNATGNSARCQITTCVYGIQYSDQSFSAGYLATDTLTLSSTEIINDFYFGCGQNNQGLFGKADGIIGLTRDKLSIISQTSMKYGKIFSYCIPSTSSRTGYLTLGKSVVSKAVQYIPFASSKGTSFYFIDILAIYVGGQKLPISQSVFSTSRSIIDSGTVISRLPPAAYTVLRNTFRQQMSKYSLGKPISVLDTCYDFSKYKIVKVPTISFVFGGNKKIDIDSTGILFTVNSSSTCLPFAPNRDASDVTIYGNVQQKTMQVVYDVAGGKLGFGAKGCA